jgi:hypothetical protein
MMATSNDKAGRPQANQGAAAPAGGGAVGAGGTGAGGGGVASGPGTTGRTADGSAAGSEDEGVFKGWVANEGPARRPAGRRGAPEGPAGSSRAGVTQNADRF